MHAVVERIHGNHSKRTKNLETALRIEAHRPLGGFTGISYFKLSSTHIHNLKTRGAIPFLTILLVVLLPSLVHNIRRYRPSLLLHGYQAHRHSSRSVNMASLRRNRTMPTDGAIAKFLYTILKQLDLKSVNKVPSSATVEAYSYIALDRLERSRRVAGYHKRPCSPNALLSI